MYSKSVLKIEEDELFSVLQQATIKKNRRWFLSSKSSQISGGKILMRKW